MKPINIEGLEKYYITENGNIYSTITNKMLKTVIDKKGYENIKLRGKTYKVHRLVALTYIKNINNYDQVNHIDGNKSNNNVKNLEWCNNSYNQKHAWDNNLRKNKEAPNRKFTDNQVEQIRKEYFESNISHRGLAEKYGVSKTTITDILNGRYYNTSKEYKGSCINKQTKKKLNDYEVKEIIAKYNTGKYSYNKIAQEYGVNHKTIIRLIKNGGYTK